MPILDVFAVAPLVVLEIDVQGSLASFLLILSVVLKMQLSLDSFSLTLSDALELIVHFSVDPVPAVFVVPLLVALASIAHV